MSVQPIAIVHIEREAYHVRKLCTSETETIETYRRVSGSPAYIEWLDANNGRTTEARVAT